MNNIIESHGHLIAFEPMSGCWLWSGCADRAGYGKASYKGKSFLAHRMTFVLNGGTLIDGMDIDHKCKVRGCVNPDHLQQITHLENINMTTRNGNQFKTHCPKGHPYDGDNLVVRVRANGGINRLCRQCERKRSLAGYYRSKSA